MTEANVSSAVARILSGMATELARGSGPEKWCKRCGRKHARRAPCQLVRVPAKSGAFVERSVHSTRVKPVH